MMQHIDTYIEFNQALRQEKVTPARKKIWDFTYRHERTSLDRKNARKSLSDSMAMIRLRRLLSPLVIGTTRAAFNYKIICENDYHPVPGKSIIFAPNHSSPADAPISFRATKRHSYVLVGKQSVDLADWMFFKSNGVIYVDRDNRNDTSLVKDTLHEYLDKGESILWFPEGSWNLTDNLPVMPLKWGIINVARESNAQIIPMYLKYDHPNKTAIVRFGDPIHGEALENPTQAIDTLRESIANMWWDVLSRQQPVCRKRLTLAQMQEGYLNEIRSYLPLDLAYEQSIIYRPKNAVGADEVFAHLKNLAPTPQRAFLFGRCSS